MAKDGIPSCKEAIPAKAEQALPKTFPEGFVFCTPEGVKKLESAA